MKQDFRQLLPIYVLGLVVVLALAGIASLPAMLDDNPVTGAATVDAPPVSQAAELLPANATRASAPDR